MYIKWRFLEIYSVCKNLYIKGLEFIFELLKNELTISKLKLLEFHKLY